MKIVVAGISAIGLNNLSDDAMFYSFCQGVKKNFSDVEITLLTRHPDEMFEKKYLVKTIKNLDHDNREQSLGRFFLGLNPRDDGHNLEQIRKVISECDVFVLDGEPFIDISLGVYKGLLPHASIFIVLAKMYGKPIFINSTHIGRELKTEAGREYTRFCLSNAKYITTRGEKTNSIFKSLGLDLSGKIHALSDPAYALDVSECDHNIFNKIKLDISSNYFIITTRCMYWTWGDAEREKFLNEYAQLCDWIIDKYNQHIVLVPHNTYSIDKKYMNDIPVHSEVREKCKNKDRIISINETLSVKEVMSLYSSADFVVSNRRHSLIFAALYGVPSCGFGEVLHVGSAYDELGVSEYFLDIDAWDISLFKEKIDDMVVNGRLFNDKYLKYLPELIHKATSNIDYLTKVIKEK